MRFGTDDEDSSLARAGMLREGPRPPPFGYRARERHPEGTDGAVPSEVECKAVWACRPERRRRRGGMTGSSSASEAGRRKGEVAICAIVRRRPCIRRNRCGRRAVMPRTRKRKHRSASGESDKVHTLGIVRSKKIGCTFETAGSLENFNLSRKLQSNALGSEIVCFLLLLVLMCVFYWF